MDKEIKQILDYYKDRLDIAVYKIADLYNISPKEVLKKIGNDIKK